MATEPEAALEVEAVTIAAAAADTGLRRWNSPHHSLHLLPAIMVAAVAEVVTAAVVMAVVVDTAIVERRRAAMVRDLLSVVGIALEVGVEESTAPGWE